MKTLSKVQLQQVRGGNETARLAATDGSGAEKTTTVTIKRKK